MEETNENVTLTAMDMTSLDTRMLTIEANLTALQNLTTYGASSLATAAKNSAVTMVAVHNHQQALKQLNAKISVLNVTQSEMEDNVAMLVNTATKLTQRNGKVKIKSSFNLHISKFLVD